MTTAARLHESELIADLLAGLGAKTARIKFGAAKSLEHLSRQSPELLYPHFDFFAAMLGHENQILSWNAMLTLANLAPVDSEGKLDLILDAYLSPISGPALITAANAIRGAARIAAAKPHLAKRITRAILRVERAAYPTPECRNVAIGHALRAFDVLPPTRAIRGFARRHLANPRPATAAKAAQLLRRIQSAAV
jgi:hypothetical protein